MHVEMEALVHLTNEKGMSLEQLIQAIEVGKLVSYYVVQFSVLFNVAEIFVVHRLPICRLTEALTATPNAKLTGRDDGRQARRSG